MINKVEPLEIKRSILNEIENCIVSVGGGERRFPYAALEIRLFVANEQEKSVLLISFIQDGMLEIAIHNLLTPPRCVETKPVVDIVFSEELNDSPPINKYEINFIAKMQSPLLGQAYLEVLVGAANCKRLRLNFEKTYIGRCEEASAEGSNIVRKNDLYFLDSREFTGKIPKEAQLNEKINKSVSRLHAHIIFNDGVYYIYDDGSNSGTTLLRSGRGIPEKVDQNVGKELKNGDVICLGKARLKFKSTV